MPTRTGVRRFQRSLMPKIHAPLRPTPPPPPLYAVAPVEVKQKSFPIVGIGASAGGLEAFTKLLHELPLDTGMAFVLIQHLAPDHKSLLAALLSRQTKLPITEVKNNMAVEPNHVYVIPPNARLSIQGGILILGERKKIDGHFLPIDYFLRSLAADKGSDAIAVILSGGDGDGSHAMEAIKAEGGITFAQTPQSSQTDSMPVSAAATGLVDFVLTPEKIAAELGRIAMNPTAISLRQTPGEDLLNKDEVELGKIYALLQCTRGIDFSFYKQATLKRRIARRMVVRKLDKLKDYAELLVTKPEEVASLYDDILIHVTEFFRDPETFASLKTKVFPRLMKGRLPQDPIRIWVPGCATGEEVYSILICLLEFLGDEANQNTIQMFATDISEKPLQKARSGIYSDMALSGVSVERRRRFFTPVAGGFQILKSIQDRCIFAKQNVTKDPPFSKLDLISCRNLLIYLGPELQQKVIPILNYALKPKGLLLLGNSETLGVFPELFDPVDKKMKLYAKQTVSLRQHPLFSATIYPTELPERQMQRNPPKDDGANLFKEADRYVLEKHAPAGVIIDGAMNIIQFRGPINQYLELSAGTASHNLFKLAKEELLFELRPAILRAKKQKSFIRTEGSPIKIEGRIQQVSIEVIPLKQTVANESHFMVLFEELPQSIPSPMKSDKHGLQRENPSASKAAELEIARLGKVLNANKDYLQSIINDLESANEELKSANEESLSSNEEFQSANEELETAKEELQATNEETVTLNEELQNRNLDLTQLNNDMVNLMSSANVPIVILGKDHHIRRLTPAAEKMLKIAGSDIGRSIHELKLDISIPELKTLVSSVLSTFSVEQREIQDAQGHWYNLRIQPYKTSDDKIDGIVLSFLDIQMAKERQAAALIWVTELESQVKRRSAELAQTQNALHQAEKLEAIGRLAGGVAHDFNNLMTGILGITEDLQKELGPESPYRDDLDDILNAARKATAITKQLLAFGRRQVINPQVLNLNHVIGSMDGLFKRLLGEDIQVRTLLDTRLGSVHIDPGNLEQVILNLGLNGRDAMLGGGTLTLQTANVELGEDYVKRHFEVKPGPYVVLTVSDTGTGMSKETIEHMFEPFFTTKGGKGTGLGLANVYGIVKNANGDVVVDSEPGKGTSFRIYLPRVEESLNAERPTADRSEAEGGTETILVTEDEDIVRKVVVRALRKKGYQILHASTAQEAFDVSEKHAGPIHLLVTDVVMPGMNGRDLAKAISAKRPEITVLYMSGYNREIIGERGNLEPGTNFIEKTFRSEVLCQKVRTVLDAAKKQSAAGGSVPEWPPHV